MLLEDSTQRFSKEHSSVPETSKLKILGYDHVCSKSRLDDVQDAHHEVPMPHTDTKKLPGRLRKKLARQRALKSE